MNELNRKASEYASGCELREGCTPASIFAAFFRVGLLTVGGGLIMVGVIRHELLRCHWVTQEELGEDLALATSFPGAIAVNLAIIIGYRLSGVKGATAALLGVVLPSFSVMLIIAAFLLEHFKNEYIQRFFSGAGCGVVGLIGFTTIKMVPSLLKRRSESVIFAVGLLVTLTWGVNPLTALFGTTAAAFVLSGDSDEHDQEKSE